MAHQLRRQAASHIIPQIKDTIGIIHTDPIVINSVFSTFYSSLDNSEAPSDLTEMHSFLDELNFPTIAPDVATNLDSPLTTEEIILAINNMQSNKAPGPDGFPVEFFKKCKIKLAPILHSVYIESLESGSPCPSLYVRPKVVVKKKR